MCFHIREAGLSITLLFAKSAVQVSCLREAISYLYVFVRAQVFIMQSLFAAKQAIQKALGVM